MHKAWSYRVRRLLGLAVGLPGWPSPQVSSSNSQASNRSRRASSGSRQNRKICGTTTQKWPSHALITLRVGYLKLTISFSFLRLFVTTCTTRHCWWFWRQGGRSTSCRSQHSSPFSHCWGCSCTPHLPDQTCTTKTLSINLNTELKKRHTCKSIILCNSNPTNTLEGE